MKSRRMSLITKTENQQKKTTELTPSINHPSLIQTKTKFPTSSSFIEKREEPEYIHVDNCSNQTLQNVLAKTSNQRVYQQSKQSVSCMYFAKTEQESNSNLFKKDQQQQLCCQNYKRQKRKYSASYSQKNKRVDSLLLQFLQERLEHYTGLFKKIVKKSISKFCTYEEGQSYSLQNQDILTSKLVLWTEAKLHKIMQQYFRYLLAYPKEYLNQKNKNTKISSKSTLMQLMKQFMISKYKTEKLAQQNYLNLTYSLYNHLIKAQQEYRLKRYNQQILCKIRYFQIFDRILTFHYDNEDILFYLYMKWLLNKIVGIQNCKLNQADLNKFLNKLTNNDIDLVNHYYKYCKKMFNHQMIIYQQQLLYFILTDFKSKKQQINMTGVDASFKKINLKVSQKKKRANNTYDQNFWLSQLNSHNIQPKLYSFLKQQMLYQTKRLIDILCTNIKDQSKLIILNLITTKACRIMHAISDQRKLKLFQQLNFQIKSKEIAPSEMITYLQQMQSFQKQFNFLRINFLKNQLNQYQISDFVKKILVCRLFLGPLETLVQNFEDF